MVRKPKSTDHSESKSPSTSPHTSQLHAGFLVSKQEEEESTTIAQAHDTLEQLSLESPEVQSLIHKLQSFLISPQKSEVSQSSETSKFNLPHPLTRLQSRKLGIEPTHLPLPKRKRAKKNTEGFYSETFSSTSSISSSPVRSQPSIPSLHIIVHQGLGTSTSQPAQSSISTPSQTSRISTVISSTISVSMADPWTRPGAVNMPAPLHGLPDALEKWLPKFNPDDGTQAEEHINNFMLSVNLKGVMEEDVVVRLFPYTSQGLAGSWYFPLPYGSITSWATCQE